MCYKLVLLEFVVLLAHNIVFVPASFLPLRQSVRMTGKGMSAIVP
jgi:hypothetical protein